jgi:PAS domain S-box-containing protein
MTKSSSDFLSIIDSSRYLHDMFNSNEDLYFFIKDRQSAFIMCNRALLDKIGISEEKDIIGRTDYDFFHTHMADKYREEDREVFDHGRPILNRVWLVPNASGKMEWYVSSKFPLFNQDGNLIGLAGLMRDYERAGAILGSYESMSEVIQYIHDHFQDVIEIRHLASLAHLSVSQFERRFKALFKVTPIKYINQCRLDAATEKLRSGEETIATIAHECGFYDHSYFSRQFKRAKGITPQQYRQNRGLHSQKAIQH